MLQEFANDIKGILPPAVVYGQYQFSTPKYGFFVAQCRQSDLFDIRASVAETIPLAYCQVMINATIWILDDG